MTTTVLIADDDAAIRTVLGQALSRAGYDVRLTSNLATLWRWVSSGEGDVVISDLVMPDDNLFDVLPSMREARPELPFVIMSAQNTFMTAVKASEFGAYEYLPKPFDISEVKSIVARAVEESASQNKSSDSGPENQDDIPLVGRSNAMQEIYRLLARMMQTDLTVMISGESGTGKELVARALHDFGKRTKGPFVAINMAAIPHDLIESELFGHEKGAFTGAQARSSGRFELANGGTLFLDEIGDMPMDAQTRLLRVLQQGEYTTVGGRIPIKTDVRIVAATNKDLGRLIDQGLFREDLYYRLNVVPVRLPPLRQRADDVPDLVRHFLLHCEEEGLGKKHLTPDALDILREYQWPGNVRELENLVRRLVALYPQDKLDGAIVQNELDKQRTSNASFAERFEVKEVSLYEAVESHMERLFRDYGDELPPAGVYQNILQEVEAPLLTAVLARTNGNQLKSADLLGLNRNTLRKKIKELNLQILKPRGF